MKINGISGSRGVAVGTVYTYIQEEICIENPKITEEEVSIEQAKVDEGLRVTLEQLDCIREKALQTMGPEEAAIFEAHMMIAQDPSLIEGIKGMIASDLVCAAVATETSVSNFAAIFLGMDDPYMRERGADIKDIGDRLERNILGMTPPGLSHLSGEVILVAQDLTPSDTASLDKNVVKGIITAAGGPTSHAAIMARTLTIPAVMGVGDLSAFCDGDKAIVLGTEGHVLVKPDADTFESYRHQAEAYRIHLQELKESSALAAVTTDGQPVELFGNIGKAKGAIDAFNMGAEGIGLFRTEFLFMENDELPSEEVQFQAYKEASENIQGKALIIRTMDIGGDKELKCLDLPEEMNPFLGYRAIRISLTKPDIFKVQLRAILRASAFGDVRVMFPMVTTISEVKQGKALLEEAKAELRQEGIAFNENLPVGIMVEVPATAIAASLFAKHVDFFSIGTNDLCQYTLAVDRMNENISQLYQPMHPAVLRLIKNVIDASHQEGKFTGMCGEVAGDPRYTMVLLGLGLDEFSMSASSIPVVKNIIRHVSIAECQELVKKVMTMETAQDITNYITKTLEEKCLSF